MLLSFIFNISRERGKEPVTQKNVQNMAISPRIRMALVSPSEETGATLAKSDQDEWKYEQKCRKWRHKITFYCNSLFIPRFIQII